MQVDLDLDTFIKTKSNGPYKIRVIMGNVEVKSFPKNKGVYYQRNI